MNRKFYLLSLLLGLSACAGNRNSADASVAYHDFGPAPMVASAPVLAASLEVRMPSWLDSLSVQYRLLYAEPTRLREFAQARWAANPSALIGERLRQRLGLVGGACRLSLRLEEFSQQFADVRQSTAVLRGEWVLSGPDGQLLGRRPLRLSQPAAATAEAGVVALATLSTQAAEEAAPWLRQYAAVCQKAATR